jgi:N-acetylmuramoyl-L-alanine amidase
MLIGGCATGPRGAHIRAPDWESEDVASAPGAPHVVTPTAPLATVPVPAAPPLIAPPMAQGALSPARDTWVPLNRWCELNSLKEPNRLPDLPAPTYSLNTSHGLFLLRTGTQLAQWEGLEFRLGFAPQMVQGNPYVHSLDLRKTIEPLLSGAGLSLSKTNPVLVIDPGHGGVNAGTRSVLGNGYEKDFTLDWARRLQHLLITNGWQVFLTRTNDTNLALSNRVAFAEAHKADLFLSLHFNSAAPNEAEAGLETYCLTPAGMTSSVTRGFEDDPSFVFPNNSFDAQNLRFAFLVHGALLQANGERDRGVRRARFLGVLRNQQRPAILVEGGYLSNRHEARLIANPEYRQKLAEAVARALTVGFEGRNSKPDNKAQKTAAL